MRIAIGTRLLVPHPLNTLLHQCCSMSWSCLCQRLIGHFLCFLRGGNTRSLRHSLPPSVGTMNRGPRHSKSARSENYPSLALHDTRVCPGTVVCVLVWAPLLLIDLGDRSTVAQTLLVQMNHLFEHLNYLL